MKDFLFGYDGRLNRGAFWKAHFILLGLLVAVWILCGLLALLLPAKAETTGQMILTGVVVLVMVALLFGSALGAFWSGVCLGIKRYHDHDKPGIWVCIQFVPVIGGMWYFVEAFCLDGTHGPNSFGGDPLGRAPYAPYPLPVTVPVATPTATPVSTWPVPDQSHVESAQVVYAPRPATGRPGWVLPVMFVLLVPPGLALAAGLIITARSATWLSSAIHVDGTVTGLKPGGKTDKGNTQYYPIVEGTTADGKTFTVTGGAASYPPSEVGSKLDVAYPPGKPDAARVVDFVDFWLFPVILDSFGIIVVGWLFVILIVKLAWKRKPGSVAPSASAASA